MEKKKSNSPKNKFFFKLFRDVPDVKLIVEKLCQPRVYMKPSGIASILHFGKRGYFGPYGPNRGDRLRVNVFKTSLSNSQFIIIRNDEGERGLSAYNQSKLELAEEDQRLFNTQNDRNTNRDVFH